MSAGAVIEYVIAEIAARRPEWTLEQVREMVELGRETIALNPQAFVRAFDENVARFEAQR